MEFEWAEDMLLPLQQLLLPFPWRRRREGRDTVGAGPRVGWAKLPQQNKRVGQWQSAGCPEVSQGPVPVLALVMALLVPEPERGRRCGEWVWSELEGRWLCWW